MSGVHGNSGVHDLDYPSLDKAVARSSEKRWGVYSDRQSERDKVRKETGATALSSDSSGNPVPADPAIMGLRKKALETFGKLKKD